MSARAKRSHGVVEKNPGASLIDLGDGIACIEFHSKMNTLGGDIVGFVQRILKQGSEAARNFSGFVICNDAANFSVGANLMQVLLAIQDEEWDELDRYVREFQAMTQAIRFCVRPVIVAPFGMCLGGEQRLPCMLPRANRILNSTWAWWKAALDCCLPVVGVRK